MAFVGSVSQRGGAVVAGRGNKECLDIILYVTYLEYPCRSTMRKMQFNIGILFIATILLLGVSADDDADDDGLPDDVDIDDDNDGIIDAGKI